MAALVPFFQVVFENLARRCIAASVRNEREIRTESLLSCALHCLAAAAVYRGYLSGKYTEAQVFQLIKYAADDLGVSTQGYNSRVEERKEVI